MIAILTHKGICLKYVPFICYFRQSLSGGCRRRGSGIQLPSNSREGRSIMDFRSRSGPKRFPKSMSGERNYFDSYWVRLGYSQMRIDHDRHFDT